MKDMPPIFAMDKKRPKIKVTTNDSTPEKMKSLVKQLGGDTLSGLLKQVIDEDEALRELLENIPVILEDHPSVEIMDETDFDSEKTIVGMMCPRPTRHIRIFKTGILLHPKSNKKKIIRDVLWHEAGEIHGIRHQRLVELGI